MFELKGKIQFDPVNVTRKHSRQSSWKKTAMIKIDDDTWSYYAWFIEKRFNLKLNKPLRGTHITIINDKCDFDIFEQARTVFDGKEITLKYDPTCIRANKKGHWWIKVYCEEVKSIRIAMGMTPEPYFGLHLTIGIATHLQLEHSNYILDQCIKFNL
jgi:hypothetical protein